MNKKIKKIMLGSLACIMAISVLSACKEENKEKPGSEISSGNTQNGENTQKEEDMSTYNNGGNFVKYKGKTYFREYSNSDIQKTTLGETFEYDLETRNAKYINAISSNGKITNVFQDNGYKGFYIVDDRFYFNGYDNKLYTVNMSGEDYLELCKGQYAGADTENHRMYYINQNNENALYAIDTQTLKITKLDINSMKVLLTSNNNIYLYENNQNKTLKISTLNAEDKVISDLCTIDLNTISQNIPNTQYEITDAKIINDKLFLAIGYYAGTAHIFQDSRLYAIDLKDNSYKKLETNISNNLLAMQNNLYYEKNISDNEFAIKSINSATLESIELPALTEKFRIEENLIMKDGQYLEADLAIKTFITSKEIEAFKTKYGVSSGDTKTLTKVHNVQKTSDKLYYLLELSKPSEEASIGWREGYDRVASEMWMYDIKTQKRTLLYSYKVTDKEETTSGDIYGSGNNFENNEPLAENEMYVEIKLEDKGKKDTFEIRVEEVGGLIIGKRIEYEGTHTRSEKVLKIKVTKEIGAMLNVYIDNEIDTQMLIEE